MKILLTHGYFLAEDEKELQIMRPYMPLGILYLSAWLEQHNYANEVFDSTFSTFEKLEQNLLENKPDIVAVYVNLMTRINVLRIIKFIKSNPELSHCKIVLGGPEVRSHAEKLLEYGADIIIIGEGEQTMLEVVEYYSNKSKKILNEIAGIAFLENNQATFTPERDKLKDLDILPLPSRKKVNLNLYFDAWKQKHGTSAISVSTMRGCPYTCNWCSRAVYGQSYRRRSPKAVVEELKWIQSNYSVDSVWFVDDVFTVSHKWMEEFAALVKEANLKFPYECITRADRMNETVIKLLKESGCFRVWIGAESGSQAVIDHMDRRVDVNQVREMIKLTRQHGIEAGTFIMVGYPGETEADIWETVNHLKQSNPDYFTITVAYPISGTPLHEEVASSMIKTPEWALGTDRDKDFKRTFPRPYYDFAVRMIVNEVHAFKAFEKGNSIKGSKHKLKSVAARAGMWVSKF